MSQEQEDQIIQSALDAIKNNHPYLLDIMAAVKKTPNGMVNLSIRVYNGFVTDLVATDVTKLTYKPPKK